uniref:Uncharacterized protein n=1 Tax=Terrapene triunguis TaxID=2587831 RepID=A0A674I379_9SAUR
DQSAGQFHCKFCPHKGGLECSLSFIPKNKQTEQRSPAVAGSIEAPYIYSALNPAWEELQAAVTVHCGETEKKLKSLSTNMTGEIQQRVFQVLNVPINFLFCFAMIFLLMYTGPETHRTDVL